MPDWFCRLFFVRFGEKAIERRNRDRNRPPGLGLSRALLEGNARQTDEPGNPIKLLLRRIELLNGRREVCKPDRP